MSVSVVRGGNRRLAGVAGGRGRRSPLTQAHLPCTLMTSTRCLLLLSGESSWNQFSCFSAPRL